VEVFEVVVLANVNVETQARFASCYASQWDGQSASARSLLSGGTGDEFTWGFLFPCILRSGGLECPGYKLQAYDNYTEFTNERGGKSASNSLTVH